MRRLRSHEPAFHGPSQELALDERSESGLARLPIDRPQSLRLRKRHAQPGHLGILGLNSTRQFAGSLGARWVHDISFLERRRRRMAEAATAALLRPPGLAVP
jgi:hypothetical protein